MRKLLTLFMALAITLPMGLQAQRTCGTMDHKAMLEAQNPKLAQKRADMEARTQDWIQTEYFSGNKAPVVYNIPVVFHVVYRTGTENIPDSRLLEQLDVLNADFRKLNADVSNVPAAWQGIAADCEVNFCLAQVDPNGQPTTGITRTNTSTNSWSTNDNVKYTSQGGKDAWPRDEYLNIWVCNLGGGLLGYAQFPGGPAATDGVVLDYAYTGVTGASAPFNKGRTATHEVGHWLGLYHIWGDDGGSCSGSDLVADTPNQASETYGCPSGTQTDACSPSSPGYMWMNYMDYVNDACMYFFTAGQKARVQSTMAGSRNALASSTACTPIGGVSAQFSGTPISGCAPLTVQFTDASFGSITTWNWNFGDGNTSTQQNPSHTYNTPGIYTVTLYVSDGTNNDTEIKTDYIVVQGGGQALPFSEGFEGATFLPTGWTMYNPDGLDTWQRTTSAGYASSASAWIDNYNYAANGEEDGMILPPFDFSGYASVDMTWDVAYRLYSQTGYSDTLRIHVSTDCGNTWTMVWEKYDQALTTITPYYSTTAFVPANNNQWRNESLSLNAYAGMSGVQIKISNHCDYENNLYVDNINLTGVTAAPVADFSANSTSVCEGTAINFTDLTVGAPTSWSWNFGDGNTSTQQNPSHTYAAPGTYTVTLNVTNTNGSDSEIKTNYIVVNANPSVSTSPTQPSCGNPNGAITATASGGGGSYTYAWSNGGSGATQTALAAGTYTVTVTDANTCTSTETLTLTDQPGPSASISSTSDASCGSSNGSATATATGGTGSLSYSWSNGGSSATVGSLAAGTYTVTVTDQNGCTSTAIANISNIGGPTANISNTVHTSCGQNNGSATASGSGGTGSLSYSWSNGGSGQTISNLAPGNYSVTITDQGGCVAVTNVTIDPSSSPTASATGTDATCGVDNGTATASATGGTSGYSYSWSNGGNTAAISNLGAGTYTVTVTDAAGCTDVTSVTVSAIAASTVSVSGTDALCAGSDDGTATATASGSGPYTYAWSNGGSGSSLSGLAPGTYTVTVTDANGCTATDSYTVTEPSALSATTSGTDESAPGAGDGTATATASGGTGPYTYAWSNGGSGATLTGLGGGTYTVTVTDANGCTTTETVLVGTGTGIAELPEGVKFDLYPNPNEGAFHLDYTLAGVEDLEVGLYNSLGQRIIVRRELNAYQGRMDFDVQGLADGIYYLRIRGEEFVTTKRLIVSH